MYHVPKQRKLVESKKQRCGWLTASNVITNAGADTAGLCLPMKQQNEKIYRG
jgi:hypothetical protein